MLTKRLILAAGAVALSNGRRHARVLFASDALNATALLAADGVLVDQTIDVTEDVRSLVGELLVLAREQVRAADGTYVFKHRDLNDVLRRWLGEGAQHCDACGQCIPNVHPSTPPPPGGP